MAPSLSKYSALIIFFSFFLGGYAPVNAVPINNIYSASVPIASQYKQDRLRGFDQALSMVLVKASGQFDTVTQSALIKSLFPAEPYVQTFSYRENPAYQHYMALQSLLADKESEKAQKTIVDNETSEIIPLPYLLDVSFAPSIVKEKMVGQSLPVWGSERPSVLVWIVSEKMGERSIIGASDTGELVESLFLLGQQRGLPLYLPVADLQDVSAIDIDDLWGLYPESVDVASERYRPDAVVMLRVYQLANGQWSGNWLLNLKQVFEVGEKNDSSMSELVAALVSDLAEKLSSHYAVATIPGEEGSVLNLEIDQVNTFTDYIEIQRYLAELPPVASMQMNWVHNGRAGYTVKLIGAKEQLFQHIDLGGRLKKDLRAKASQGSNLLTNLEVPVLEETRHVLFQANDETEEEEIKQDILIKDTEYYIWSSGRSFFPEKIQNSDQE